MFSLFFLTDVYDFMTISDALTSFASVSPSVCVCEAVCARLSMKQTKFCEAQLDKDSLFLTQQTCLTPLWSSASRFATLLPFAEQKIWSYMKQPQDGRRQNFYESNILLLDIEKKKSFKSNIIDHLSASFFLNRAWGLNRMSVGYLLL